MSRFAGTATTALPQGPLATISDVRTPTHEGGSGFAKDARTELFSLAVSNFVGGSTFYESGKSRDDRFQRLVREVALLDPQWMTAFLPWLRNEANMRTASVIAAVEYAIATPGTNGRQVIASTLARADEPAEALAYFMSKYGRKLPKAVKRGIADAAVRLYNENAALKYDSAGANMRMGDVIELTHPDPKADWQSALFQYVIDRRHNRENPRGLEALTRLRTAREGLAAAARGEEFDVSAGMTWEQVLSAKGASKATWEEIIPQMGYMALLRNLRNFEQHQVDDLILDQVAAKLRDPDEVAKSRQLPFRFWSAWKNSGTMRFGSTLDKALELSVGNIPEFPGKTLVLVDVSGSMHSAVSSSTHRGQRSKDKDDVAVPIMMCEAGALFGAAVAKRSAAGSVLAAYATDVAVVKKLSEQSLIRNIEAINQFDGVNGHGTNTWPAVSAVWQAHGPFDRILIFTDCQDHPSHHSARDVPASCPIYVWDLRGYAAANIDVGSGRYLLAGLTDQSFKIVRMLEKARTGVWPWEVD